MNFYELIEYRKSVRDYKPDRVETEKLERVINAGRLAPYGTQAWKFIIVKDEGTRKKLAECTHNQHFVAQAPICIVICAEPAEGLVGDEIPCSVVDACIASTQMILVAAEEGLGTCWVGAFAADPVRKLLGIPDEVKIVAILPLGYPVDDSRKAKQRKSLNQIVCEERYSE
jgi:nitroreductase